LTLYYQKFTYLTILFPLLTVVGYEMGDLLSPDLDQIGVSNSEALMMRRLGPLGALWAGYFMLYAYLIRFIGGHRSFWSHSPFIGTGIRLVYGTWFMWLGLWWYRVIPDPTLYMSMVSIWLGLSLSDGVHWLADIEDTK